MYSFVGSWSSTHCETSGNVTAPQMQFFFPSARKSITLQYAQKAWIIIAAITNFMCARIDFTMDLCTALTLSLLNLPGAVGGIPFYHKTARSYGYSGRAVLTFGRLARSLKQHLRGEEIRGITTWCKYRFHSALHCITTHETDFKFSTLIGGIIHVQLVFAVKIFKILIFHRFIKFK